jgi:hypothetical protein
MLCFEEHAQCSHAANDRRYHPEKDACWCNQSFLHDIALLEDSILQHKEWS